MKNMIGLKLVSGLFHMEISFPVPRTLHSTAKLLGIVRGKPRTTDRMKCNNKVFFFLVYIQLLRIFSIQRI